MKFNKQHLSELIQYSNLLASEGKSLFKTDPEKNRQFIKSMVVISDGIYWENRQNFLNLLEKFLDGKIDGEEFTSSFFKIWRSNRDLARVYAKDIKLIQDFQFNPKTIGFSSLTAQLFSVCDSFVLVENEKDLEYLNEVGGLDEDSLRYFVKKYYLEMKEYD